MNLDKDTLRNKLLDRTLPDLDSKDKIPKFYLEMIDEALESVLDGSASINGKKAQNLDEAILLSMHVICLNMTFWDVAKETILETFPDHAITVNYRGTTQQISKTNN